MLFGEPSGLLAWTCVLSALSAATLVDVPFSSTSVSLPSLTTRLIAISQKFECA
jgi:hypothetical protein